MGRRRRSQPIKFTASGLLNAELASEDDDGALHIGAVVIKHAPLSTRPPRGAAGSSRPRSPPAVHRTGDGAAGAHAAGLQRLEAALTEAGEDSSSALTDDLEDYLQNVQAACKERRNAGDEATSDDASGDTSGDTSGDSDGRDSKRRRRRALLSGMRRFGRAGVDEPLCSGGSSGSDGGASSSDDGAGSGTCGGGARSGGDEASRAAARLALQEGQAVLVDEDGAPLLTLASLSLRERFPVVLRTAGGGGACSAGPGPDGAHQQWHQQRSVVRGANGGRMLPGEKARLRREKIAAKRAAREAVRGFDAAAVAAQLAVFVDSGGDMLAMEPCGKHGLAVTRALAGCFGLTSTIQGSGAKRFALVRSTPRTAPATGADAARLQRLLQSQVVAQRAGAAAGAGVSGTGMALEGGAEQRPPSSGGSRPGLQRGRRRDAAAGGEPLSHYQAPVQFVASGVLDPNVGRHELLRTPSAAKQAPALPEVPPGSTPSCPRPAAGPPLAQLPAVAPAGEGGDGGAGTPAAASACDGGQGEAVRGVFAPEDGAGLGLPKPWYQGIGLGAGCEDEDGALGRLGLGFRAAATGRHELACGGLGLGFQAAADDSNECARGGLGLEFQAANDGDDDEHARCGLGFGFQAAASDDDDRAAAGPTPACGRGGVAEASGRGGGSVAGGGGGGGSSGGGSPPRVIRYQRLEFALDVASTREEAARRARGSGAWHGRGRPGGADARFTVAVAQARQELDDGRGAVAKLAAAAVLPQALTSTVNLTAQQVKRAQRKQEKERRREARRGGEPGEPGGASGREAARRASAAAAAASVAFEEHTSGIGSRLLARMGWNPGEGLGRQRQGMAQPLLVQRRPHQRGLGA